MQITTRRAFTIIELIGIIIFLAILSAIVVPMYFRYAAETKESATKSALGGMRTSIANFYANSAVVGKPTYPTLEQLTTVGTVMQERVPRNPYNRSSAVRAAVWSATPLVAGKEGWGYDVATGRIWANSRTSGVNENFW